jgi:hypothetical protein
MVDINTRLYKLERTLMFQDGESIYLHFLELRSSWLQTSAIV